VNIAYDSVRLKLDVCGATVHYTCVATSAPTITIADLAPALAIDSDIFALCAFAPSISEACKQAGFTFAQGMAMFIEASRQQRAAAERVHTGYQPKAERMDTAHRSYRDGLKTPPARALVNDAAGQKARARVWGHAC